MQTRRRQARIERQVTGTRLEAADDHPQQRQIALGQQRHRLVDTHPGSHQCMPQAVGLAIELCIADRLLQTPCYSTLRMGSDTRLEQLHITLLQRVIPFAAVAVFQQQTALLFTLQRQLAHVALEAIGQGQ
ncbi:hypothetical protein D3C80_1098210 [compost metagenome]